MQARHSQLPQVGAGFRWGGISADPFLGVLVTEDGQRRTSAPRDMQMPGDSGLIESSPLRLLPTGIVAVAAVIAGVIVVVGFSRTQPQAAAPVQIAASGETQLAEAQAPAP